MEDRNLKPVCTFVKIAERTLELRSKVVVGSVKMHATGEEYLQPVERHLRKLRFRLSHHEALSSLAPTSLIACTFVEWPESEMFPLAQFKVVNRSLSSRAIAAFVPLTFCDSFTLETFVLKAKI